MTMLTRAIPKTALLVLALATLVRPAAATITYTSCNSGCSSTTGTYAVWQTAPGSAGLTFSMSPATFAAGNLSNGVYSDSTGTVLTGYNGANPNSLLLSGTALTQSVAGTGTGIQFTLPANTYALSFMVTTVSGFGQPMVAVNDFNLNGSNYQIIIPNSSSPQFFGIISDTALSSIFVGNNSGGGALQLNSFEVGETAPVPEIPSAALIGGGLTVLGIVRRRRWVHKPDCAVG